MHYSRAKGNGHIARLLALRALLECLFRAPHVVQSDPVLQTVLESFYRQWEEHVVIIKKAVSLLKILFPWYKRPNETFRLARVLLRSPLCRFWAAGVNYLGFHSCGWSYILHRQYQSKYVKCDNIERERRHGRHDISIIHWRNMRINCELNEKKNRHKQRKHRQVYHINYYDLKKKERNYRRCSQKIKKLIETSIEESGGGRRRRLIRVGYNRMRFRTSSLADFDNSSCSLNLFTWYTSSMTLLSAKSSNFPLL